MMPPPSDSALQTYRKTESAPDREPFLSGRAEIHRDQSGSSQISNRILQINSQDGAQLKSEEAKECQTIDFIAQSQSVRDVTGPYHPAKITHPSHTFAANRQKQRR